MNFLGQELKVKEIVEIVAKAAGSFHPITASAVTVYNEWQNKVQYSNVCNILEKHNQQLSEIKDKLDNLFMNSNEYIATIIQTILKGQNELNESKRNLYANYLTACCLKRISPQASRDIFLDLLYRLEPAHLLILEYLDSSKPQRHQPQWSHHSLLNNLKQKDINYNEVELEINIEYLVSLSLVEKIDVKGVRDILVAIGFEKDMNSFVGSENVYYRSSLGNTLINFMN